VVAKAIASFFYGLLEHVSVRSMEPIATASRVACTAAAFTWSLEHMKADHFP
jgi:hypothetical protein